jgi:hypothetical protein
MDKLLKVLTAIQVWFSNHPKALLLTIGFGFGLIIGLIL